MNRALKEVKVNFTKNLHHQDIFEMLGDAAHEECGSSGLCSMEFSNMYYNGKIIRLDTVSVDIKIPIVGNETSDVILWFKIAKKKTRDALRDVYELLEMYEGIENIKYVVNRYEVKTDYAIMSFDSERDGYRQCRGVDIHFKDK